MLTPRTTIAVVAIALALSLAGCSTQWYVGVRYEDGRSLEFFPPLCGDQVVERVWLEDLGGEELWDLRAVGVGAQLDRVEFGSEPDGYESDGIRSLAQLGELGDVRLRVNVQTSAVSQMIGVFELSTLPTDGSVTWYDDGRERELTVAAVDEAFQAACSSESSTARRMASGIAFVAIVGGALAALLVWRRRSRRARTA